MAASKRAFKYSAPNSQAVKFFHLLRATYQHWTHIKFKQITEKVMTKRTIPDSVALYRTKAPRRRVGGYEVTNNADAPKVRIFGPVDSWERTAQNFSDDLEALYASGVTAADLEINSFGGNVFEALAVFDVIQSSPIKFRAVILGVAASAASLIACACEEIVVGKNARFMIHEPETGTYGRVKALEEVTALLRDVRRQSAELYAAKSKQPVNIIEQWMEETKWMRGQEIVDLGFADAILDIDAVMEIDEELLRDLDNVPADLLEIVQAESQGESAEASEEEASEPETPEPEMKVTAPVEPVPAAPAPVVPDAKMQAEADPVVAALKSGADEAPVMTARPVEAAQSKTAKAPAPWAQRIAEMNRNFGQF